MDAPKLMTITEVAQRLGVGRTTVRNLVNSGLLGFYRVGGRCTRFSEAHVEAYLASAARTKAPTAPRTRRPRSRAA